jgi:RNA polymerase sigma factor (sigma-70 family)
MPRTVDELIPTRASLLRRLRSWEDQSSWQEFFDTYWRLIYQVARGAGLNYAEAQDVVQETMVTAAKHLPNFQYDPAKGSFKGWLFRVTRSRIIDQLRKRGPLGYRQLRSDNGTTSKTDTVAKVADPACPGLDDKWEEEWQRNLFKAALTNVKRRLAPQQYQIFHCLMKEEQRQPGPEVVKKVAATFAVSVDYVYVAKHRVAKLIKQEVRRLEKGTT